MQKIKNKKVNFVLINILIIAILITLNYNIEILNS